MARAQPQTREGHVRVHRVPAVLREGGAGLPCLLRRAARRPLVAARGSGPISAIYCERQQLLKASLLPHLSVLSAACPLVLAGTGEENVKGLLRRAEATDIVKRIREGELRPGEVGAFCTSQKGLPNENACIGPLPPVF